MEQVILVTCGIVIVMTVYMLVYTVTMMIIDSSFISVMSSKKLFIIEKVYVAPYKTSPVVVGFSSHLANIAKEWGIESTSSRFEEVVVDNHIVTVHK